MPQDKWTAVDLFFTDTLNSYDPILASVLEANEAAGLPPHDVAPNQGKLLYLLARLTRARRILEIGTLGGYSTIWLARALPHDGRIVTLEANGHHAAVARANFARAGLADKIDVCVGNAVDTLAVLHSSAVDKFDFVFVDADKPNNPVYLDWAMKLARSGAVIVGDNVVRDGLVVDEDSTDEAVQGVRRFVNMMGRDPRLEATALQTVGIKGWDGFSIALVNAPLDSEV